jgi:hypothetical protein
MKRLRTTFLILAAFAVTGCAAHLGSKKVYLFSLGPAVLIVTDREIDTETVVSDEDEPCDTATSDQD